LANIDIKANEKYKAEPKKDEGISDKMIIGISAGSVIGVILLICIILSIVYLVKKPSI
jgi:hypothetical protein